MATAPRTATATPAVTGWGARAQAPKPRARLHPRALPLDNPEPARPHGVIPEVDMYRDTPLRYAGYANEVGEAFAYFLPPVGVPFSYAVAIAYVVADSVDKGRRARIKEHELAPCDDDGSPALAFGSAMCDALTWQLLASVAFPGSVIHATVAATNHVLHTEVGHHLQDAAAVHLDAAFHLGVDVAQPTVSNAVAWVPTLVGLSVIPHIVHPIDNAVHSILNHSLRPGLRDVALHCLGDDGAAVVRAMLAAEESDEQAAEDADVLLHDADEPESFPEPSTNPAEWATRAALLAGAAAAPFTLFGVSDAVFGTIAH